jgi:hypothetical protein
VGIGTNRAVPSTAPDRPEIFRSRPVFSPDARRPKFVWPARARIPWLLSSKPHGMPRGTIDLEIVPLRGSCAFGLSRDRRASQPDMGRRSHSTGPALHFGAPTRRGADCALVRGAGSAGGPYVFGSQVTAPRRIAQDLQRTHSPAFCPLFEHAARPGRGDCPRPSTFRGWTTANAGRALRSAAWRRARIAVTRRSSPTPKRG